MNVIKKREQGMFHFIPKIEEEIMEKSKNDSEKSGIKDKEHTD